MYTGGVISKCPEGLWQSPIFVVPKKATGEYRLVTDFRRVNKELVHEWLPSKRTLDMLNEVQVCGPQYFSTVDLQSAFFSIPYAAENSEANAFYADCGTNLATFGESLTGRWKYDRLVMGCQTSSAVLNRAMEICFSGLNFVKVYCDDLLIFSKTKEDHFYHLKQIFERLTKYGVKLSAAKCILFQQALNVLGYHISSLGYRPEEDKLKVVKDMLPSTSIKEIRSCPGFFNFYKIFIPNYSYYSGQISCLTRKNGLYVSGPI